MAETKRRLVEKISEPPTPTQLSNDLNDMRRMLNSLREDHIQLKESMDKLQQEVEALRSSVEDELKDDQDE